MICSSPFEIRINWNILLGSGYTAGSIGAIKSLLYYLAHFNLGQWSSDYLSNLNTLPLPYSDAYAAVRTGDAFLSVTEEAALIGHFDSVAAQIAHTESAVSDNDLVEAGVLICSYQFGLRPVQIGRIPMKDVQIWRDSRSRLSAVHLTFKMAKQRNANAALPMTRKVKHEWAPIFVELYQRGERSGLSPTCRLFRVSSAVQTGKIIVDATTRLLTSPRSATALRHTAAQRLADSGASQAEVAEFLGHSLVQTSSVYITASPNQAERVNRALGISPRYQTVVKVARDGYINREELARLKGEQQVAGAPHGMPVSGIGGCTVGQPSCPFNPVTSCYGCQKFMPLAELEIHKQVLADLRNVVRSFSDVSRGDLSSPSYQQLERTISSVQAVITELEEGKQK
jgi:integrase